MHMFVGSTVEGGISRIMDDGLPRWAGWPGKEPWEPPTESSALDTEFARLHEHPMTETAPVKEEIRGGCHCGGVKIVISRPPVDFAQNPDLKDWVKE